MENGWIKLYRKILINDGLFRSAHTFTVWCWLLLKADRKTGEVTVGRYMLSDWLKIKPSTVYQTLKRLENMTMVKLKSNNKATTVSILNWHVYQNKYDNKKNLIQHESNTIQEDKKTIIKKQEIATDLKIPNRLILSRGMKIAYAKEFAGITTMEIEEQRLKCNAYMNMSSSTYTNPGLFFKGWLKRYISEKKAKENKEREAKRIIDNLPIMSPEQVAKNLEKLAEMRKNLRLGVRN